MQQMKRKRLIDYTFIISEAYWQVLYLLLWIWPIIHSTTSAAYQFMTFRTQFLVSAPTFYCCMSFLLWMLPTQKSQSRALQVKLHIQFHYIGIKQINQFTAMHLCPKYDTHEIFAIASYSVWEFRQMFDWDEIRERSRERERRGD